MTAYYTRFRQTPELLTRRVGQEVLVAPMGKDDFDCLDGTSGIVWDCLEVPRTFPDLLALVASIYQTEPAAIAADLEGLVDDLGRHGLIEEVLDADV